VLVLKFSVGDGVTLFDEATGQTLGRIVRLAPKPDRYSEQFPDQLALGFEMNPQVLVVRDKLLARGGGPQPRSEKKNPK
jgi:hypothetical protein